MEAICRQSGIDSKGRTKLEQKGFKMVSESRMMEQTWYGGGDDIIERAWRNGPIDE